MFKTTNTASQDWRENTAQALASFTFVLAAYGLASAAVDFVGLIL